MKLLYRTRDYAFIISAMGKLFVTVFASTTSFNTAFNTLLNPDTLPCTQFKSCTLTDFWLRDILYRHTAPVPATKFVTGDKFVAPIKLVPRHS
jgi:hypothetical protein